VSATPEPRYVGPQSFAPAKPGSITADPLLVHRNLQIEKSMLDEAQKYYALEREEDLTSLIARFVRQHRARCPALA
jgi:hypothetical protein